jgi:hypothetical protein
MPNATAPPRPDSWASSAAPYSATESPARPPPNRSLLLPSRIWRPATSRSRISAAPFVKVPTRKIALAAKSLVTRKAALRKHSRPKSASPNPRRVAAGKRNYRKRRPLTAETREKLRRAAIKGRPWERTPGPRTPEGKAKIALNGKKRQKGGKSLRERRAETAGISALIKNMVNVRKNLVAPACRSSSCYVDELFAAPSFIASNGESLLWLACCHPFGSA